MSDDLEIVLRELTLALGEVVAELRCVIKRPTMSVTDVAHALGCCDANVRNLIKSGKLAPVPDVGVTVFRTEDVERFVRGE